MDVFRTLSKLRYSAKIARASGSVARRSSTAGRSIGASVPSMYWLMAYSSSSRDIRISNLKFQISHPRLLLAALKVLLQQLLEFLPSLEYMPLHCFYAASQCFGHLFLRQLFDGKHHNRQPLLFGQLVQS